MIRQLQSWEVSCGVQLLKFSCLHCKDESILLCLLYCSRDVDDRSSCQALQILFSFSVPCQQAFDHILNLKVPIISAGAVSITVQWVVQCKCLGIIM